jgi:c-di-GMP-binding flagellar brake protein YcgR
VFNFRRSGDDDGATPPVPPNQKRQSYRAAIEFPVVYVVDGRPGARTAGANDLSVGGLRLLGDEDFTRETIIDFRFTLPTLAVNDVYVEREVTQRSPLGAKTRRVLVPPTPFEPLTVSGKIVIAFYNARTQRFAHGVRFLSIPQRMEDEIQRFIHLYQLKALRARADRLPQ